MITSLFGYSLSIIYTVNYAKHARHGVHVELLRQYTGLVRAYYIHVHELYLYITESLSSTK